MPDHPLRRGADQGPIGKTKSFMQDWGWVIYIVGSFLLMLGFRYITPRDEIDGLQTAQVNIKASVDSLKEITRVQAADIKAISLLQCFNRSYSTGQLRLVGIDCTGIRP